MKKGSSLNNALMTFKIVFVSAPINSAVKCLQMAVVSIISPLSIYFSQQLINSVEITIKADGAIRSVYFWICLLTLSMFIMVGNAFFDSILLVWLKRKLNTTISTNIVEKFKKLDYSCFEDVSLYDAISRMGVEPLEKILDVFLNAINIISLCIILIGSALIFSQISFGFFIGFVVMIIPMVFFNYRGMRKMNDIINEQSLEERKLTYLSDMLTNKSMLYEFKVFRTINYITEKWRSKSKKVFADRLKVIISAQGFFIVTTVLFIIWSGVVAVTLIRLIIERQIEFGLFTALALSIGTIISQSQKLSNNIANFTKVHLEVEHYYHFINLPEVAYGSKNSISDAPLIKFENVFFTYPKMDKPVLKGVSFEIQPHERLAIVGENGAGKSTLIKLLLHLFKPDSGKITVDGIDISELSQDAVRKTFSVIYQDYSNYYMTLRENIALGNINKLHDDDALITALKQGLAGDVINMSSKGLDMNLGKLESDGVDLSGGQWQRVALSRALLSSAAFIIMDEPTAAMDPVAESEMYLAFDAVLKNRGYLMISHRLASAKMSDRIIVLSNGVVEENGNHDELMKSGNLYYEMFTKQSEWYKGAEYVER